MKKFSFEKLEVWNLSRLFTKHIYNVSREFPDSEKFGLTSQIRRAAISVSSNIAEGSARITGKEQARYTEIAYSSLLECLNQIIIAIDLKYLVEKDIDELRPLIDEIANKLNKLRKSQLQRDK